MFLEVRPEITRSKATCLLRLYSCYSLQKYLERVCVVNIGHLKIILQKREDLRQELGRFHKEMVKNKESAKNKNMCYSRLQIAKIV